MAKKLKITIEGCLKERELLGENQSVYWGRLGLHQSTGSRYDNGRKLPRVVRMLIALNTGVATVEQLQSGELAKIV
jgi:hypothetical protein